MKKLLSGIMVELLFLSLLIPSFNIQPIKAEPQTTIALDGKAWSVDASKQRSIFKIKSQDIYSLVKSGITPWGDWKHYHDYVEIVNTLLYLNETYPNIVDVFSIGKSWQNRNIYCIRLTNEGITHPKPKVFFVGFHHAREPISAELPLYFAVKAATSYSVNATVTYMLDYSEIYIVVALNVDAFYVVNQNEWQRKNAHPFDEDGDSLFDEDPPDDEDGDGYIELLWQWDGYRWVFVRWEGIDDDGDGLLNEDWIGGVDLNRNYGYKWNAPVESGSPEDEDYRGPSPFSEPETQALRNLALQHDFKYAISFHSGADVILYPWGYILNPTPDNQKFQEIASIMSTLVGSPYQQASQMYTTSGVWDDWMYGNRSTYAFTCEVYRNNDAWQYEPGPLPNSLWEKGVFRFFNPDPSNIEPVIKRWLPVFIFLAERAITEAYDIATTSVATAKKVVGQGFPVQINVTVANQGDFTETFDVTVYTNETSVASQTVTLTSGSSTTITFTWNTTGFAKGNYTITAQATPILGETDTADNTYIHGNLLVTTPGDVNGDHTVDIFDIGYISAHWYPGPPAGPLGYDLNADVNGDGAVDIFDIGIASAHWEQSW